MVARPHLNGFPTFGLSYKVMFSREGGDLLMRRRRSLRMYLRKSVVRLDGASIYLIVSGGLQYE